jgi:diguanylate cyclase (GGDEF)-like protein
MLNLSKKFGFDVRRQQARLQLLGLNGDYKAQCYRLQREVLRPAKDELARKFMIWLRQQDELLKYIGEVEADQLRNGLLEYIETFGIINSETYFESRLRVGLTHWMLNVPVSLFTCGHRYMQQLIVGRILQVLPPADSPELVELALKITALDLTLVSDTYRLAQVHHLVKSLKNQMDETHKFKLKAMQDPLTGLPNRGHLMTLASNALRDSRAQGYFIAVIMADIDYFKKVNDTHGHPTGDAVLVTVSQRMTGTLRTDDVVGRYGGEEFMIVLRSPRPDEFWSVAERIRLLIAATPVEGHGNSVPVTISMGLAAPVSNEEGLGDLIKRADKALYDAKHGGRNRVVVST